MHTTEKLNTFIIENYQHTKVEIESLYSRISRENQQILILLSTGHPTSYINELRDLQDVNISKIKNKYKEFINSKVTRLYMCIFMQFNVGDIMLAMTDLKGLFWVSDKEIILRSQLINSLVIELYTIVSNPKIEITKRAEAYIQLQQIK